MSVLFEPVRDAVLRRLAADVLLLTGRSPSWVERSAPELLTGVDAIQATAGGVTWPESSWLT